MSNHKRLLRRAINYIVADEAIPLDLALQLFDAGIDVCALEGKREEFLPVEQTEFNFDEE